MRNLTDGELSRIAKEVDLDCHCRSNASRFARACVEADRALNATPVTPTPSTSVREGVARVWCNTQRKLLGSAAYDGPPNDFALGGADAAIAYLAARLTGPEAVEVGTRALIAQLGPDFFEENGFEDSPERWKAEALATIRAAAKAALGGEVEVGANPLSGIVARQAIEQVEIVRRMTEAEARAEKAEAADQAARDAAEPFAKFLAEDSLDRDLASIVTQLGEAATRAEAERDDLIARHGELSERTILAEADLRAAREEVETVRAIADAAEVQRAEWKQEADARSTRIFNLEGETTRLREQIENAAQLKRERDEARALAERWEGARDMHASRAEKAERSLREVEVATRAALEPVMHGRNPTWGIAAIVRDVVKDLQNGREEGAALRRERDEARAELAKHDTMAIAEIKRLGAIIDEARAERDAAVSLARLRNEEIVKLHDRLDALRRSPVLPEVRRLVEAVRAYADGPNHKRLFRLTWILDALPAAEAALAAQPASDGTVSVLLTNQVDPSKNGLYRMEAESAPAAGKATSAPCPVDERLLVQMEIGRLVATDEDIAAYEGGDAVVSRHGRVIAWLVREVAALRGRAS